MPRAASSRRETIRNFRLGSPPLHGSRTRAPALSERSADTTTDVSIRGDGHQRPSANIKGRSAQLLPVDIQTPNSSSDLAFRLISNVQAHSSIMHFSTATVLTALVALSSASPTLLKRDPSDKSGKAQVAFKCVRLPAYPSHPPSLTPLLDGPNHPLPRWRRR